MDVYAGNVDDESMREEDLSFSRVSLSSLPLLQGFVLTTTGDEEERRKKKKKKKMCFFYSSSQ
jgi:hypothetical protein